MSIEQSQEYKGNGKHKWEEVGETDGGPYGYSLTIRLRVPGGWLYTTHLNCAGCDHVNTVFVPMPEVIKHKV